MEVSRRAAHLGMHAYTRPVPGDAALQDGPVRSEPRPRRGYRRRRLTPDPTISLQQGGGGGEVPCTDTTSKWIRRDGALEDALVDPGPGDKVDWRSGIGQ